MSKITDTYRDKYFRKMAEIDMLTTMQYNKLERQARRHETGPCVAMLLGSKPRYPLCPCYSDRRQCFDCLCELLNEKVK